MKYTLEFKLDCVDKYKNGIYIDLPEQCLSDHHNFMNHVQDWARIFEKQGAEGLKHSIYNKEWTPKKRFDLVAKVLAGNSIRSVAREAGINPGQLFQWARRYDERGMEGLECHKGRRPKMPITKKRPKLTRPEKEELALLREKNKYLELENLYLKKLDALVSKREAAQSKATRQKRSKRSEEGKKAD